MKRVVVVLSVLVLVAAACGGGDDEPAATPAPTATEPTAEAAPTTRAEEPSGDADAGAGSSSEFCGFITEVDDELNLDVGATDAESLRALVEQTQDALDRAEGLAPSEIRGDVAVIADAYDGFASLLDEYDYDVMTAFLAAEDDPRLLALEAEELAAASSRIGQFCGVALGVAPDPGVPDVGAGGEDPDTGETGGGESQYGSVPDVLVPPDVVEALDMGNGAVLFRSGASFDEIVDFYTEVMGDAFFVNPDETSGVWQARIEGAVRSVTVGAGDGTIEIFIAQIGG